MKQYQYFLDASRAWIVYWILQSAHLLNFKFSHEVLTDVIHFLVKCRSPSGGFAGGPNQFPHLGTFHILRDIYIHIIFIYFILAPTYAAVLSLCLIETDEALEAIDM